MDVAILCKFNQYENLRRELLATGDTELVLVHFLHHTIMGPLRLTGEKCRTQLQTYSGGAEQIEVAATSLEEP